MEIYIETFLIQNIIINLCLLKLVETTSKYQTSFFKLFIASTFGAVFSVLAAIVLTNNILINILKIACSFIMLKISFKTNLKQFITSFILLFFYTFAFGGAIINLSSETYITELGVLSKVKFNLSGICIILLMLTYIFDMVAKNIKNKSKTNTYIIPIQLELNNKKIKINAYMDSGNLLQFDNKPVVILDLQTYLKLSNTDIINFYLNNSNSISTSTITGCQNLKIFRVDKITIFANKKIELNNQLIAINNNNSFKNTNYQALLSPLML